MYSCCNRHTTCNARNSCPRVKCGAMLRFFVTNTRAIKMRPEPERRSSAWYQTLGTAAGQQPQTYVAGSGGRRLVTANLRAESTSMNRYHAAYISARLPAQLANWSNGHIAHARTFQSHSWVLPHTHQAPSTAISRHQAGLSTSKPNYC